MADRKRKLYGDKMRPVIAALPTWRIGKTALADRENGDPILASLPQPVDSMAL